MSRVKVDLTKINMSEYYQCGKYLISNMCEESYPCGHIIIDTQTCERFEADGLTIFKLLEAEKITDPHFEMYRNGVLFGGDPDW